jgi:hypothetical protein
MSTPHKNPAIERVRAVVEDSFVKIKSGSPRKDVVKLVRYEGADYYLFKNGKWAYSRTYQGFPIDHFDLEKPDSEHTKWGMSHRRYRGEFQRAAKGLVKLGIVTKEDYEVVRLHIMAFDRAKYHVRLQRELEWQAKELGVQLIYPKGLLDDGKRRVRA